MIEENGLDVRNSVENTDKIRVVTKDGLSQSIEVSNLKNSLSINVLSGKVSALEDRADTNDDTHDNMDSRLDDLESIVGDEGEGTIPPSGLVKKVSDNQAKLDQISPTEINRHGTDIDGIHTRLTEIDGTNGRLDVLADKQDDLTQKQTNLESVVDGKLDQSVFQDAVAEGFKIISPAPSSASAAGEPGEIRWDTTYLYVCVGTNTWKRTPLGSW